MEEEALTPFGLVEVLDKFHVATVTTYMELEYPEGMIIIIMSTCSL